MKKVFLSVFVIITFILYAWTVRVKGDVQNPVIAKISATPTVTPVPPTPTPTSAVSQPSTAQSQPTATLQPQGQYKDGSYTGSTADAFYGPLQVKVTVSGGKITDVQFLQYPNDQSESVMISQQATPQLAQEAIQAQSAQVDAVSGATQTSQAFVESMKSALAQAKS